MENFDRLPDLSNINADEDWLPLIFDNKTLEQFDDDDYSLGVFSEGYSSEDDGSITLFARGCNEPGLDLCTKYARLSDWAASSVRRTSVTRTGTTSLFLW